NGYGKTKLVEFIAEKSEVTSNFGHDRNVVRDKSGENQTENCTNDRPTQEIIAGIGKFLR
ncbi:MAG: hypothetical protein WAZ38_08435, partial [Prolixibacteraceae bacterium]